MSALPEDIEEIHPSLWRANQLASQVSALSPPATTVSRRTARRRLADGLAYRTAGSTNGHWRNRLLEPALKAASKRAVVFIKPLHVPNALGRSYLSIPLEKIMLLRSGSTADTLCTSEQVFENEHLRCRPTLAGAHPCRVAAPSNSARAVIRVIAVCRATACGPTRRIPASLRLATRPATNGVRVSIVKRKRPIGVDPFVWSSSCRGSCSVRMGAQPTRPAFSRRPQCSHCLLRRRSRDMSRKLQRFEPVGVEEGRAFWRKYRKSGHRTRASWPCSPGMCSCGWLNRP